MPGESRDTHPARTGSSGDSEPHHLRFSADSYGTTAWLQADIKKRKKEKLYEMTKLNYLSIVGLAVGLLLSGARTASAFTSVNIGTGGADHIFVGLTYRPSSSTPCDDTYATTSCPAWNVAANYACIRGTSATSTATWYYLGGAFTGIDDDMDIEGNGGNDRIDFFRGLGQPPGGVSDTCRGGIRWNDPTLGGHYIDGDGGSGDDVIFSGDTDTWLKGGAGEDVLYEYDSNGQASGGDNNDILIGVASSEDLVGGNGDDCFFDANLNYFATNGGAGTDRWDGPAPCPSGVNRRLTSGSCFSTLFFDTAC